jgi:hypothetical protein
MTAKRLRHDPLVLVDLLVPGVGVFEKLLFEPLGLLPDEQGRFWKQGNVRTCTSVSRTC